MGEWEQILRSHLNAAVAAAGLVLASQLVSMVLEFKNVWSSYPKRIALRRRVYLGLWGAASPWLDWLHMFRLLKPGKSVLRVGKGQLLPVFIEGLHKATPTRVHFVFVHGTWATENFRSRWQPLIASLKAHYPRAKILGLHWLAFNGAGARHVTAMYAVRRLRQRLGAKSTQPVIFVGFSHGGTLVSQIMRHPACPKNWHAVTVGMPLLLPETNRTMEAEKLYGQDLLWHPIHSKIGGPMLAYGWPVFSAFFVLAYFTADQFGLAFKVLCWILLALRMFSMYFDTQLEQQGKHNDAKINRSNERRARILRRRVLGNDADYLAYHLAWLHRDPPERAKIRTVHIIEQMDEVLLFSDAGFDTTAARKALNGLPAKKAALSDSVSRVLETGSSNFIFKWLWPGPAIWAFREIEWFGAWNLHRKVRKESDLRGRSGYFFAPRGLLMIAAGIFTFGICSIGSVGLVAIDAVTFGPWFNAAVVMFVGLHPCIVEIQSHLGRLAGIRWSQDVLKLKIRERARLLSPAYDSCAVNDRMQLHDLSGEAERIRAKTAATESLSLGRHRASIGDPWVVARVLEAVGRAYKIASSGGPKTATKYR